MHSDLYIVRCERLLSHTFLTLESTCTRIYRLLVISATKEVQLHSQQQQVDGSVHQAVLYQNVAFSGQDSAGTEYQNVDYSHRANTRN